MGASKPASGLVPVGRVPPDHAIGRSRGGLTTKIQTRSRSDAAGSPAAWNLRTSNSSGTTSPLRTGLPNTPQRTQRGGAGTSWAHMHGDRPTRHPDGKHHLFPIRRQSHTVAARAPSGAGNELGGEDRSGQGVRECVESILGGEGRLWNGVHMVR